MKKSNLLTLVFLAGCTLAANAEGTATSTPVSPTNQAKNIMRDERSMTKQEAQNLSNKETARQANAKLNEKKQRKLSKQKRRESMETPLSDYNTTTNTNDTRSNSQ